MTVSHYDDFRDQINRVVFMEKNGRFLAWRGAETIEDAEKEIEVVTWYFAKDIEQKVEITLEEIGRKFGVEPNLIKICYDKAM